MRIACFARYTHIVVRLFYWSCVLIVFIFCSGFFPIVFFFAFTFWFSYCFCFVFISICLCSNNVAHRAPVSAKLTGIRSGGPTLEISHAQVHYERSVLHILGYNILFIRFTYVYYVQRNITLVYAIQHVVYDLHAACTHIILLGMYHLYS